MNFEDLAKNIDPEIYQRFKVAIELGKWPDGRLLSREQKELCLQAILIYEAKHQMNEGDRVGYVDTSKKTSACSVDNNENDSAAETIKFLH